MSNREQETKVKSKDIEDRFLCPNCLDNHGSYCNNKKVGTKHFCFNCRKSFLIEDEQVLNLPKEIQNMEMIMINDPSDIMESIQEEVKHLPLSDN